LPLLDMVAMWWHTAFGDQPSAEAAQLYHFDMDRIRWVKVFIHLTDVTADTGPHCFVSGSHRTGAIPRDLLERGYARLSDEDVRARFGKERLIEHLGPRGTILVEDTRGLHKGKVVTHGDRLLLQLEFTSSLFGANYTRGTLPEQVVPELAARLAQQPEIFQNYAAPRR